jgi:hypothetical protein
MLSIENVNEQHTYYDILGIAFDASLMRLRKQEENY